MARFKDFDAYEEERRGEPIEFQLGGQRWHATNVNHVNFLALVRAEMSGTSAVGYDDFVHAVIADDQREEFDLMLQRCNVSLQTFAELSRWIVEQATGAPLSGADVSPSGHSKPGRKPRVVSLSRESDQLTSHSAAG